MTPTLSTERLILAQLTSAKPRHVAWLNDPEVVAFSEQRHKQHTVKTCQSYITSFQGHFWAIKLVSIGLHIGNITAACDQNNNVAEIGILIGEKTHWKNGYGREAWQAVSDWLLDKGGGAVRKLEGGCMSTNVAMRRIFEQTRFEYEGERKAHFVNGVTTVGKVLYGRFP